MIFIPKENVRRWNWEDNLAENVIWTYNDFVEIYFTHFFDSDSWSLREIHTDTKSGSTGYRTEILRCPELACNCIPDLRYNNIIKKYWCTCASSMVCTKNTDESEMEHFKECNIKNFTEEKGFADDPLKAILLWQNSIAEYHRDETKNLLKRFFK